MSLRILRPVGGGAFNVAVTDGAFLRIGDSPSFRCLDEKVSDGDLTCLEIAGPGGAGDQYQLARVYQFEALPAEFDEKIQSVTIVAQLKEVGSGVLAEVQPYSFQNGIIVIGDPVDFLGTADYTEFRFVLPLATDPDSLLVPWTREYVNGSVFGLILVGEGNAARWTQVFLEVATDSCSREVELVEPLGIESAEPDIQVSQPAGPAVQSGDPDIAVEECP